MPSQSVLDLFPFKSILEFDDLPSSLDEVWHGFELTTNQKDGILQLADIQKPSASDLDLDLDFQGLQIHEQHADWLDDNVNCSNTPPINHEEGSSPQISDPGQIDVWRQPDFLFSPPRHGLIGWDRFNNQSNPDFELMYLTESKKDDYNAFWNQLRPSDDLEKLQLARGDQFHRALTNLVLGRNSAFFSWNFRTSQFHMTVQDFAITGYSPVFTMNICDHFARFGSCVRRIREYCREAQGSSVTRHALQGSLMNIIHGLERYVVTSIRAHTELLIIQQELSKFVDLFSSLEQITQSGTTSASEGDYLNAVLKRIDELWVGFDQLRPVLSSLASDIIEPALHQTCARIGMFVDHGQCQDNWLLSGVLPDYSATLLNISEYLSFVENLPPTDSNVQSLSGYLVHTWSDLIKMRIQTDHLEETSRLRSAVVLRTPYNGGTSISHMMQDSSMPYDPFTIDFKAAQLPVGLHMTDSERRPAIGDRVVELFEGLETSNTPDLSPLQALRSSLSPLIEAQDRICSYKLMRTLFLQHHLVDHLNILHDFQLLGDGFFAVRLSKALFTTTTNQEGVVDTARNKSGLVNSLYPQDREAWPPASSELRLILTGLLSGSVAKHTSASGMLDCISFAIREMSDGDAQKCRDIYSVQATHFLRLTYSPLSPIFEFVITPTILDKYDRIFDFMLVLLRMHSLSQNLLTRGRAHRRQPRTRLHQKICIRMYHLVSVLTDFALNIAIELPWNEFQNHVTSISRCLERDEYQESMRLAKSVAHLCRRHDDMLEDVIKALLLKKEHVDIYNLVCKLFSVILRFAATTSPESSQVTMTKIYDEFEQLSKSWHTRIRDICKSTNDRALLRAEVLLLRFDLFG